jgi:hypothetical protein
MNINSQSNINPYIQSQPPQKVERTNVLEQDQNQTKTNDTANVANQDTSSQAFQVSITDQAKQALQTGQLQMEAEPTKNTQANVNQTETYGRNAGQGPSNVIDLVA